MKKFYFFAVAALLGSTAMMADETRAMAYEPEEFVESEWNLLGEGLITPGYFDYFGSEEGGTMEYPEPLDTWVYESLKTPGDYYILPLTEWMNPEQYLIPSRMLVHTQNPEKVWTEPFWWQHPLLFCFFHAVPEVLGYQGSAANYGTMNTETLEIKFPASSHVCMTIPTGTPTTNNGGNFTIVLSDGSGVNTISSDNAAPEFYTFDGVKVSNPEHGLFIVKRGNKVEKIVR